MVGSFITRAVIMALGYVYPAYECYKIVETNRPDIEQLRFWCQYWIIIAVMTVLECWADILISWVPLYSEAKLAFIIYLWYPKTMGTTYVYTTLLRPLVVRHESDIDQNLNELRARAGDVALHWWQRGSLYVQSRFFEVLQFLASQPKRFPPDGSHPPPARPGAAGAHHGDAPYYPPAAQSGQGLYPPYSYSSESHPRRRPYGRALSDEDEDYGVVDDESEKRTRFRDRLERSGPSAGELDQNPRIRQREYDSPW